MHYLILIIRNIILEVFFNMDKRMLSLVLGSALVLSLGGCRVQTRAPKPVAVDVPAPIDEAAIQKVIEQVPADSKAEKALLEHISVLTTRVNLNSALIAEVRALNERGDVTAKSTPFSDSPGLMMGGELLLWKGQEEGREFACIKKDNTLTPAARQPFNSKIHLKEPKVEHDLGFRLALGYLFAGDNWDTNFRWTHFSSKSNRKLSTTAADEFFDPTADTFGFLGFNSKSANAKMHFNYHVFDWELGRNYFVSKSVTIRPHVGIRGALIKDRVRATYFQVEDVVAQTLQQTLFDTSSLSSSNWCGVGLRFGADTLWHMTKNWGLFGKMSAALISSHAQVSQKLNGLDFNRNSTSVFPGSVGLKEKLGAVRLNVEAAMGMQWSYICDSGAYINVMLGYDIVNWLEQNRSFVRSSVISTELSANPVGVANPAQSLGLRGGSFKVEVKF